MFHHSFTGQLLLLQFTILLFSCSHHNTTLSLNVRVSCAMCGITLILMSKIIKKIYILCKNLQLRVSSSTQAPTIQQHPNEEDWWIETTLSKNLREGSFLRDKEQTWQL